MRIGFVGCVKSSHRLLQILLDMEATTAQVVAVVTKSESSFNTDFVDLSGLCKSQTIPFHYEDSDNRQASLEFLKSHQPDIIYCFGWSYLLNKEMLDLAPLGALGFHPAPLPQARGRHPLIWALVLGLEQTAVTFFRMDEGADSGPIISQQPVIITAEDTAATLYEKVLDTATQQIIDFTNQLAVGQAAFLKQDESKATYWRKRSCKDGLIDWRMSAEDIHNLVRALTHPYPGAEFLYQDKPCNVWSSKVAQEEYPRHLEAGRILAVEHKDLLVKCSGTSAIWLHGIELVEKLKAGDYL